METQSITIFFNQCAVNKKKRNKLNKPLRLSENRFSPRDFNSSRSCLFTVIELARRRFLLGVTTARPAPQNKEKIMKKKQGLKLRNLR